MFKVDISVEAQQDIDDIESYLLRKWNQDVVFGFFDLLDNAISILEVGNVYFEKYENTGFMKYLVTKHNYIIYDYQDDLLRIHRVINNFQNPEDNYKSISKQ
ncbi:type II toxin-antitoxin system RelE/ParE family toxin [Epilithonimonas sp.]|jgi:plasmid stabilization system protein ParE|uniref:type II toxin-antitoxin system RelE/ParE family toxin n=1 Tax=Epilithonimonas sp. TaxID=2894511 RepID=UPI0035B3EA50